MTTFNYTEEDLRNPLGNNGLSSFALYFQRVMYREAVYPEDVKAPLDTWYDKQYFGRIDREQNTIVANYENLVPIRTVGRNNLLALSVVVDAFERFAAHMKNATILGVLKTQDTNEKLYDMKAYKGYEDPAAEYNRYVQQLYSSFISGLTEERSNSIINFKTFVEVWFAFLKNVSGHIPVTKTNYLLTGATNTLSSGLTIAIDNGPPQDDAYKYENWLNDPNFDFYIKAAKKFGFIVDKNQPWVLTFDLFSDAAMQYVTNYYDSDTNAAVTEDNFFDVFYSKTYLTDISDIKRITINGYKNFITNNPLYQMKEYNPCGDFKVKNLQRAELPANVSNIMTDKVLVDLYLELRSIETKNPVQITKKLKQELANIYTVRPNKSMTGLENAAQYINLVYRDYLYGAGYIFLNPDVLKDLDNKVRSGNITSVGSIAQQLY